MHRLHLIAGLGLACLICVFAFWSCTGVHEVHVTDGVVATSLAGAAVGQDDWPWWRGPRSDGIATGGAYPVRWSPTENVRWKAPVVGSGHASPCIWGQRVFVFTAKLGIGYGQMLLCYDRATGEQSWSKSLNRDGFGDKHPKNSHASATPACDGKRVFVSFVAHYVLWTAAVDLEGNLAWKTEVGPYKSKHGYGSSPALYGALVIVAGDNKGARLDRLVGSSFLAALHRETGEIVWRVKRPTVDSYGTPIVAKLAGKPQLLLAGNETINAYDPATGEEIWRCRWDAKNAASTVALDEKHVYVSSTEGEVVLCIRADGAGDVTDTHVVWRTKRGAAYVPSPLLLDGRLYVLGDKGVLTCFEATTGKPLWKQRLGGNFFSSPIAAGGLIYVTNESGQTFVLRPGERFEQIAENSCEDEVYATPAFCARQMFLRTKGALLCIGPPTGDEEHISQVPETQRAIK